MKFDYKDLKGKRKTKKGFKTKAEAEKKQSQIIEELNKGICPSNTKMNFKEAGEMYMRLHVSVNCTKTTEETYAGYLKNHIYPFFGEMKINEITPLMVKEFVKQMTDTKRTSSTINKYTKLMNVVFNFMIDNGVLARNPLTRIKSLKETKNNKIKALATKEVHRLLSKTKETYPDFYALLFTALFTGMREGELFALTLDSINWVEHKIKVDKNFSHNRLGPTKTNQIRYVDMSKELMHVRRKWQFANITNEKDLVFPNTVGNYQNAKNMTDRRFKPSLQMQALRTFVFTI